MRLWFSQNASRFRFFMTLKLKTMIVKYVTSYTVVQKYQSFRRQILPYILQVGLRGGAVGCGTVLQSGRSWVRFPMVSLEFFINVILLTALWP
jgi:type IV secretory pathway TrbF-like protein